MAKETLEAKRARHESSRSRDRAAFRLAAERGCTLWEAYRLLMDEEERQEEIRKVAPLFAGKI
jgi:hypothetical protein